MVPMRCTFISGIEAERIFSGRYGTSLLTPWASLDEVEARNLAITCG